MRDVVIGRDLVGKKMFIDLFRQLEDIHNKGFVLGEITPNDILEDGNGNWYMNVTEKLHKQGAPLEHKKDYLGWKRQNRAPEFKKVCLRGETYYPSKAGDIYGLTYSIYEKVMGRTPHLNFQLDRQWTSLLADSFGCDSNEKKVALQSLLDQCMQVSEYHRIQTCEQLKSTQEYQILFSDVK